MQNPVENEETRQQSLLRCYQAALRYFQQKKIVQGFKSHSAESGNPPEENDFVPYVKTLLQSENDQLTIKRQPEEITLDKVTRQEVEWAVRTLKPRAIGNDTLPAVLIKKLFAD